MKKALSLILALVLCLGLCACGNSSGKKFVGEYIEDRGYGIERSGNHIQQTFVLKSGGTGTYKETVDKGDAIVEAGRLIADGTITWKVEDEYVVITTNIDYYYGWENSIPYFSNEICSSKTTTETYELKGNKLINITDENDIWSKVQ